MFIRLFSFRRSTQIFWLPWRFSPQVFCSALRRPSARPDYTRRTKQECSYCHLPGGWFLNDAGKYFEKNRSLNGYKPPADPPKQATTDPKAAKPRESKDPVQMS